MNFRRLAVAVLLGASVLVIPPFAGTAAAAPAAQIATPGEGTLYSRAPVTVGGTATGAVSVRVGIQDRVGKLWWRPDGWGEYSAQSVPVGPGGTWSYTWPGGEPGDYLVQAVATAADGGTDPALPYRRFTVTELPAAVEAQPNAAIAEPAKDAIVSRGREVVLRGLAVDDVAVTDVRVAVRNVGTQQWWHPNGTWDANYEALQATPFAGSGTFTWTFRWTPQEDGQYTFAVKVRDGSGATRDISRTFFADGAVPATTVTTTRRAFPGGGPVKWEGVADDARGVASVAVALLDRATGKWLRTDGTWGAYQRRTVTLTGPRDGGKALVANGQQLFTRTGWTWAWTPPGPGSYQAEFTAIDAAGQEDPAYSRIPFTVGEPDSAAFAPEVTITAPVLGKGYGAGTITFTGTASDDTAVAEVRLSVFNRDTSQYWQPATGAWGPFTTFRATGTRTWSATWTPPSYGNFTLRAEAVDDRGLTTVASVPFSRGSGAGPGYVTLLASRSQLGAVDQNCRFRRGSVPLFGDLADDLRNRGIPVTGSIVVRYADENFCDATLADYATWPETERLRDEYGWSFVSHSANYLNLTPPAGQPQPSPATLRAETCGSLDAFAAHGHHRAWGLFLYPGYAGSPPTTSVQLDPVATCFAYGRTYGYGVNLREQVASPYFVSVLGLAGNWCNDPALTCYHWVPVLGAAIGTRYTPPDQLAAMLSGVPGQWRILQFYKLLRGKRLGGTGTQWDCTGADWRTHWTSDGESYCAADFTTALNQARGATYADPATVATAWGRR
ncbi:Ig-like domain-containing protein [Acrocarpospora catenulata]|uniref:Ig-like domain-containing protein n=1 Tax=Acrocarpospora catenulata TaxID=2836182 RepID=UPI001BD94747|nr:Ig-like domain-containing protein [Acrocarpospora catenulata]